MLMRTIMFYLSIYTITSLFLSDILLVSCARRGNRAYGMGVRGEGSRLFDVFLTLRYVMREREQWSGEL